MRTSRVTLETGSDCSMDYGGLRDGTHLRIVRLAGPTIPRPRYRRSCSFATIHRSNYQDNGATRKSGAWLDAEESAEPSLSIRQEAGSDRRVHFCSASRSTLGRCQDCRRLAGTASSRVVSVPRYRRTTTISESERLASTELKQSIDLKVTP